MYGVVLSKGDILEVQRTGKYEGRPAKVFQILGRRTAFNSTSTFSDVGEGMTTALFTVLKGDETIEIVSTNSADDSTGIGARKVEVVYIDIDFNIQTKEVTLDGLTPVDVVIGGFLQFLWIENVDVGSNEVAVGNIILRVKGAGTILTQITAGGNKSLSAIFVVPRGYTGYVSEWGASAKSGDQDVRLRGKVKTYSRLLNGSYLFQDNSYVESGQDFRSPLPFLKFPEKSFIKGSTITASTSGNVRCELGFTILIIKEGEAQSD